MNSHTPDPMMNRQQFKEWVPLITQQLRLRSVQQIFAYNIQTNNATDVIYFTLHQSVMSASFYTSEKLLASNNPQFSSFQLPDNAQNATLLSGGAVVLRVWLSNSQGGMDSILLTWGVNLSGLVYLGTQISAIEPTFFHENTLIFVMRSNGYFTHHLFIKPSLDPPLPFVTSINVQNNSNTTSMSMFRMLFVRRNKAELISSYSVDKLRRLRSLQLRMRNRTLDSERLRQDLMVRSGVSMEGESADSLEAPEVEETGGIRYAPQLLTMTTLNKMLQVVPTKLQKHQIKNLLKEIECAKAINKLLIHERDKKTAHVRKLKEKYNKLYDDYEETNSQIMENMRQLSKDKEKIKNQKQEQVLCKELLTDQISQLTTRRKKLLLELLEIYPIVNINEKYYINGIYLPNSDALNDISDDSISVALGYVAHVLKMYEYFLQIPLRYAITHKGSQSYIYDHITPSFVIKDRNFPLFTRGKDRVQFNYAVYLLNKNIAQVRWLHGQNTINLRSTLPNLLDLLTGRDKTDPSKGSTRSHTSKSITGDDTSTTTDLSTNQTIQQQHPSSSDLLAIRISQHKMQSSCMSISGSSGSSTNYTARHSIHSVKAASSVADTSEILAVPEAYLTRQLSERSLHRYAEQLECAKIHRAVKSSSLAGETYSTADNLGSLENIEEGTDILASSLKPSEPEPETIGLLHTRATVALDIPHGYMSDVCTIQPRLSRSVGEYSDDDQLQFHDSLDGLADSCLRRNRLSGYDIGSEPALNEDSTQSKTRSISDEKQEVYLRQWLETGPALICSEEHLYPDEVLGVTANIPNTRQPSIASTSASSDTPLTARTNALLARKTFNLVKPKH